MPVVRVLPTPAKPGSTEGLLSPSASGGMKQAQMQEGQPKREENPPSLNSLLLTTAGA